MCYKKIMLWVLTDEGIKKYKTRAWNIVAFSELFSCQDSVSLIPEEHAVTAGLPRWDAQTEEGAVSWKNMNSIIWGKTESNQNVMIDT